MYATSTLTIALSVNYSRIFIQSLMVFHMVRSWDLFLFNIFKLLGKKCYDTADSMFQDSWKWNMSTHTNS